MATVPSFLPWWDSKKDRFGKTGAHFREMMLYFRETILDFGKTSLHFRETSPHFGKTTLKS